MDITSAIVLGLVQGLTEFLPISSSGHLVVFRILLAEQGFQMSESPLAFDVLIHFATLIVSIVYLRKDIVFFAKKAFSGKQQFFEIFWPVFFGVVPAGVVGVLALAFFEELFEGKRFLASGFVLTALILEFAHRKSLVSPENEKDSETWSMPSSKQAFVIGLFQAFAILPSISRSGATVGAGLMLGLSKVASLKFSFLISIPVIFAASLVEIPKLIYETHTDFLPLIIGFFVSLIFGFLSIKLLEIFVKGSKLRFFAIYVFCLGVFLHFYWGGF